MRSLRNPQTLLLISVIAALTGGGVARLFSAVASDILWAAGIVIVLLPAAWWVYKDFRRHKYGADLLAVLALASTLLVGELLAGAVIGLMVATGRLLEDFASRRAAKDLTALLDRAPRHAHRVTAAGTETVEVDAIRPGDEIVVRSGEIVPVDGVLCENAVLDESALTGEALLVTRERGSAVRSGVVNGGGAARMSVTSRAADSTYAGIVHLAQQAAAESAPVARIADRVAQWFLPVAVAIALGAWLLSGDPVRGVAVLVTATPCPLILAVPIAITGGLSRASSAGVVVKDGAALEALGRVRTLVMDKTGTVTTGQPSVAAVVTAPEHDPQSVLAEAASVEQYSSHVTAEAIVRAARKSGAVLMPANQVGEAHGSYAEGYVDGTRIRVGQLHVETVPDWARSVALRARLDLASVVWVEADDALAGALLVTDRIRPDANRTMLRLASAGIGRTVLLTGDRLENAAETAALIGVTDVAADASPAAKILRVQDECRRAPAAMVGDGINDAPALAAADVGVALGSRGSTAAVQAADAVIVDDRIDRLADAVEIARGSRRLAVQSAMIGMSLSLVAMGFAAAGLLVPLAGAIVQEGIDVAVIVNSLRIVLRKRTRLARPVSGLLERFAKEHDELSQARSAVRHAAAALSESGSAEAAYVAVCAAYEALQREILPHEAAEEKELYPALNALWNTREVTLTMSREHAEIERLTRRLGRHLSESTGVIAADQVEDLRATLYGLDAILTLHFAQEEEAYFSLAEDSGHKPGAD